MTAMARITRVTLTLLAVGVGVGAIQLASGREDLGAAIGADSGAGAALIVPSVSVRNVATAVNRPAKSDRAVGSVSTSQTQRTITLRLEGIPDTSVLVQIPVQIGPKAQDEARDRPAISSAPRSTTGKPMIACEPVVSVLTEVARRLPPGRCLT